MAATCRGLSVRHTRNRRCRCQKGRRAGNGHSATLDSISNLAFYLAESGDVAAAEAVPLLQRAVADLTENRGAEHADTLAVRASLRAALQALGRSEKLLRSRPSRSRRQGHQRQCQHVFLAVHRGDDEALVAQG